MSTGLDKNLGNDMGNNMGNDMGSDTASPQGRQPSASSSSIIESLANTAGAAPWKALLGVSALVFVATLGTWLFHGRQILTKDKVQEIVTTKNPDFGTEETHIEWRDGFRLGLDYAAPIASASLVLALGSLVMLRQRKV
jgi:hypothetical protein